MKELENLTEEQLQAELERRQTAKKEAEKKAKESYEKERDKLVTDLVLDAHNLYQLMVNFKTHAINELNAFHEKAKKYGDVRSHSKGGFGLRSENGAMKVKLVRNTKAEYDERADMAEDLIREFLADMVKKRDQKVFNLITALLERGKHNEFNPANITTLLKHESDFTDERWQKAMKLFKEAHNVVLISMNVEFYQKNNMDKDEPIILTLASIPVVEEEEVKANDPIESL